MESNHHDTKVPLHARYLRDRSAAHALVLKQWGTKEKREVWNGQLDAATADVLKEWFPDKITLKVCPTVRKVHSKFLKYTVVFSLGTMALFEVSTCTQSMAVGCCPYSRGTCVP